MERNEIIKAYGTDFKDMTKRLLLRAGLLDAIKEKAAKKGLEAKTLKLAIKPNLVIPAPAEFGATTHPEVVAGIIEFLQENGFMNLVIVEGTWIGDKTSEAFEYCGYNALSARYNVPLIDGQKEDAKPADCKGMTLNVLKCVDTFDFLINVPVLKGHCQTKITCALKNMKGLIPNSEKRRFHTLGLHDPIAHLNTYIHQDFIVIDHICGDPNFEEGGDPLVRNCVMAALDPVLVDAYTATVLHYQPEEIGYVKIAQQLGVGCADAKKAHIITIEGENCEDYPDTHKILAVNYAAEEIDSCSACYAMLIGSLNRLKEEGLLDKVTDKVAIGQGYRGKTGKCGVGNCTKLFEKNVPGCPPEEDAIYEALKEYYC